MKQLPGTWKRRARVALFGTTMVPANVILTPFTEVLNSCARRQSDEGWWRCGWADDALIVQVPQGSPCVDGVLSLEIGSHVTFVGICGALNDLGDLKAGTIVEASAAIAFDGTAGERTWPGSAVGPLIRVASVRNIADSSVRHQELGAVASCVDMETAWVLAAANTNECAVRVILGVTDMNIDGAAFSSEFDAVTSTLRRAAELAVRTQTRIADDS